MLEMKTCCERTDCAQNEQHCVGLTRYRFFFLPLCFYYASSQTVFIIWLLDYGQLFEEITNIISKKVIFTDFRSALGDSRKTPNMHRIDNLGDCSWLWLWRWLWNGRNETMIIEWSFGANEVLRASDLWKSEITEIIIFEILGLMWGIGFDYTLF